MFLFRKRKKEKKEINLRFAPSGKFRVLGLNQKNNKEWIEDDFETLQIAERYIKLAVRKNVVLYIYDDKGRYFGRYGYVGKR